MCRIKTKLFSQAAFDTGKSQLTKNNLALGYSAGDFTLHTNVNDGQVFGGSVFQRVDRRLETGINLGWTASSNATSFGIGCKYALDRDASIRAKINNSSQLGLGYQQKLRDGDDTSFSLVLWRNKKILLLFPGVTLTLSTLIDGKNFNQGGHKVLSYSQFPLIILSISNDFLRFCYRSVLPSSWRRRKRGSKKKKENPSRKA